MCNLPRTKLITLLLIDRSRSIQNCQFSEMGGAGCRIRATWWYQEGPRWCPVYTPTKYWSTLASDQIANTHKDYLVPSTRIHARLIGHELRVPYGYNTFQIDAKYCSYVQWGPRRAHHGYGWFDPDTRGWYVAKSQVKDYSSRGMQSGSRFPS
jgi:hypothetical protein